jgi:proteic killer suppression protein
MYLRAAAGSASCRIFVDNCLLVYYTFDVIKSFRHRGLKELFEKGSTAAIQKSFHARCLRRLDTLDQAAVAQDMNVPGYNYHALRSVSRYSVHVNGPWCITFEFEDGDAYRVDFEQYH